METLFWSTLTVCATLCLIHIISVNVAAFRCGRHRRTPPRNYAGSVTLIRSVCGVDNYSEETLRSTFALDYAHYEVVFCVANGKDPVVPLVRRLLDEHPEVRARLLIGDERISQNPKLNNLCKGWEAATGDWVIIADSNVPMPRDYIHRLFGAWRPDTGLVCSPPIGCLPDGLWAEMECAFLNSYQARWQYLSDSCGMGFAQGKTMLWRRDELDQAGGLRRLAEEVAEDAAATKVVRETGKRVRLVDGPFGQPLGRRRFSDVWRRQLRWARLRRDSFTGFYAAEIFSTGLLAILLAGLAAGLAGVSPSWGSAMVATLWYGGEAALAYSAGWPLTLSSPAIWLLRDVLLVPLWIAGWFGNGIVWRGNQMQLTEDVLLAAPIERGNTG